MKRRVPPSDKFDRYEDGSVRLPSGKVVDAETKDVRPAIVAALTARKKRKPPKRP